MDNFRLMRKSRDSEMIPDMFLGSLSQQGARNRLNLENRRRFSPHFNQSPTFPIIPIISTLATHPETSGRVGLPGIAATVAEPGPAKPQQNGGGRALMLIPITAES